MTVVMMVLDGLGSRRVKRDIMPTLTSWAAGGLIRRQGAVSVLCSSTYPNFASIVTGTLPDRHGLFTNQSVVDGKPRDAAEVGPKTSSFFDEGWEVVVGDHNLIGVMAAHGAGRHWPAEGMIPAEVTLDMFGYVTDEEVTVRVFDALERRPELLFVQLNSPDTIAHVHGPDSEEAIEAYRLLDRRLSMIGAAIDLDRDLVMVTSDHDQETVDPGSRIDLNAAASQRGLETIVVDEGTAAMLVGAEDPGWLDEIAGVEDWTEVAPSTSLVFSEPGWWFAGPLMPDFRGAHGGRRTRSTVAVAAGPRAILSSIEPRFFGPRFGAEDWHNLVQSARTRMEDVAS